MKSTLKRTWAEINLDAIEYNYKKIKEHIGENVKFAGIVKADAYGHGSVKVGEKLRNISKGHQVLCISHLPQIAVMADQNLFISKSTDGKSTQTNIDLLDKNGKIKEIARLIGGSNLTEGVLKTAREMIQEADSRR